MLRKLTNMDYECGCDEAGRGCLAGPVIAAAVVFPNEFFDSTIIDSKLLTEIKRNNLRELINTNVLTAEIGFVDNQEIDELNILNASFEAMHRAINKLSIEPDFIIVDGNRFKPYKNIPHECIVKGDAKYISIAAASILAKTYRDEYMQKIHKEYPMYHWDKNKGYPTKQHREAIREFGVSPYHRTSFRLFDEQLSLDLE
ncbi:MULTISPECIES: ribonuclease HII [Weeksella]|uniref:ribonuclease HII n=1 Tax=Weeksella TaxID=1013 RepID=UPI0008A18445|nr:MULTISPECIES: ribonuclease HII [Weeksella]MDK7375054.1 ribonuclease HII [Weeksella virosa]OFM81658.1 ribonuclease HII [Weeksella sp. HMSC059D05]